MSAAEVKQINDHTTAERKALDASLKTGIRREGRARLYFDKGPNGTLTEHTATRAIAAKITDGFVYWLNPDPELRKGQMKSLRESTPYLLIDADEKFVGLATKQFENLLSMIDGHLDRIADRVIARLKS